MSRRRASYAPSAPLDPAVFGRQMFGPPRRRRDPADVTNHSYHRTAARHDGLPDPIRDDDLSDVLPNALLLGLVVVLAPLAPFIPVALYVGWRALAGGLVMATMAGRWLTIPSEGETWFPVDGKPNHMRRRCIQCGEWFEVLRSRMTSRGRNPQPRKLCGIACRTVFETRPLAERFWQKVNKDGPIPQHRPELGPCWVWTATRYSSGYGSIGLGAASEGHDGAHRVSWRLHFGAIPDGLCVLHHCDNRPCVRPTHLFVGTKLDNARDRVAKGRQRLRLDRPIVETSHVA